MYLTDSVTQSRGSESYNRIPIYSGDWYDTAGCDVVVEGKIKLPSTKHCQTVQGTSPKTVDSVCTPNHDNRDNMKDEKRVYIGLWSTYIGLLSIENSRGMGLLTALGRAATAASLNGLEELHVLLY
jgi:hypothetical protein